MSNRKRMFLACLVLFVFACGCRESEIDFRYGVANGESVNGLSLFVDMLEENGHKVVRQKRLSPRLDRVQTIVWAPDIQNPPTSEVAGWLEDWLVRDNPRVLIVIGRDYDAKADYLKQIANQAPADEFEARTREYNEGLQAGDDFWNWVLADEEEKWWYETVEGPGTPTSISGPWSNGVNGTNLPLKSQKILVPLDSYSGKVPKSPDRSADSQYGYSYQWFQTFREGKLQQQELLNVDDQAFAFELNPEWDDSEQHRLIVVSNGSFLLNYPLVTNADCRQLASNVANECVGEVVVLETGWNTPISDGQPTTGQTWAWIAKPPMRYIVPHFLFWGVLYCFVFYPIFGRPRRVKFHPAKSFSSHVKAVGDVMRRSGNRDWAQDRIEEYNQRSSRH